MKYSFSTCIICLWCIYACIIFPGAASNHFSFSLCALDRVAIFAVHLALINSPQQALVVLTFASVLFHGNWKQGVQFARQHAEAAHVFIPEIIDGFDSISDDELSERITQLAILVKDSIDVLTETDSLQETMVRKFPGSPCSGLVSTLM